MYLRCGGQLRTSRRIRNTGTFVLTTNPKRKRYQPWSAPRRLDGWDHFFNAVVRRPLATKG